MSGITGVNGNLVALNSYKDGLKAKSAFSNGKSDEAMNTSISLFGFDTRRRIQHEAEKCNSTSSLLSLANPQIDYEKVQNLCGGVNNHIASLQEAISWAQNAGQELMGLEGLGDAAKATLSSTLKETLSFGTEAISQTLSNVNEAMSGLSSAASAASEPVQTSVSETQKAVDAQVQKLEENTSQITTETESEKLTNETPTVTDTTLAEKDKTDVETIDKKGADTKLTDTEIKDIKKDIEKKLEVKDTAKIAKERKPDINKNIDFGKTFKTPGKTINIPKTPLPKTGGGGK